MVQKGRYAHITTGAPRPPRLTGLLGMSPGIGIFPGRASRRWVSSSWHLINSGDERPPLVSRCLSVFLSFFIAGGGLFWRAAQLQPLAGTTFEVLIQE
jgi:hypothetical protein